MADTLAATHSFCRRTDARAGVCSEEGAHLIERGADLGSENTQYGHQFLLCSNTHTVLVIETHQIVSTASGSLTLSYSSCMGTALMSDMEY